MYHELLDVVDIDDQIFDQRPRAEIHANGLYHRAVHILVFNGEGRLFLQKRSMKKDLNKGLWDSSAAGHVDAGETYGSCAPRELQEELGVSAPLKALFKLPPSQDLGMEFVQVYRCRHDGPFQLAAEEIDEGDWVGVETLDQRVASGDSTLTMTFKIIWRHYRHYASEESVNG